MKSCVGSPLRSNSEQPIGILWVGSCRPLQPLERLAEIMEIVADRAASEIEMVGKIVVITKEVKPMSTFFN